jgi:hypothetical protein
MPAQAGIQKWGQRLLWGYLPHIARTIALRDLYTAPVIANAREAIQKNGMVLLALSADATFILFRQS